jgi:hypothetical protein
MQNSDSIDVISDGIHRKTFTEMNHLWNYTEELSVILDIKSLFLISPDMQYALVIKKGGGQIEATILSLLCRGICEIVFHLPQTAKFIKNTSTTV